MLRAGLRAVCMGWAGIGRELRAQEREGGEGEWRGKPGHAISRDGFAFALRWTGWGRIGMRRGIEISVPQGNRYLISSSFISSSYE